MITKEVLAIASISLIVLLVIPTPAATTENDNSGVPNTALPSEGLIDAAVVNQWYYEGCLTGCARGYEIGFSIGIHEGLGKRGKRLDWPTDDDSIRRINSGLEDILSNEPRPEAFDDPSPPPRVISMRQQLLSNKQRNIRAVLV